MNRYRPEPAILRKQRSRDAVLLVNLGTPCAPTARAVRRYLAEFLADPRVVELPRVLWLPLMHSLILNRRATRSARKYAAVWTSEGSPLAVHTARQAKLLAEALGPLGATVDYAMRYGQPSIARSLDRLRAAGCERIVVLPLYPQYAASTTASTLDALGAWLQRTRHIPEVRYVKDFYDHPAYIDALAANLRRHWEAHGRAERLVLSFHGLPRYTRERGDPYHDQCHKTAHRLAQTLGLNVRDYEVTFQSRFGAGAWLQPYTEPTLIGLAQTGLKRVDVACPGFVSDCLETLEEIGVGARDAFLAHGGQAFSLVPCLNESPEWIAALRSLAREHTWAEPAR